MAGLTHEMVNVIETFEKHKEGKSKNLYVLMNQLKDQSLPSSTLLVYLKQLRQLVACLNKDFEVLVGFIMKIGWTSRETEVIEEYLLLINNLVSVHAFYLSATLKMIVDHLKPKHVNPTQEVTEEIRVRNVFIFQKLHGLLSSICKTIPMTPVVLMPLLTEGFPFYLVDDYTLECYVSNLLSVTSYLPKYRSQILQLIISEMTKIDVHVPVADGESSFIHSKTVMGDIEDSVTDAMTAKLDALMDIKLKFIRDVCFVKGVLDRVRTQRLLNDLVDVFDVVLLPTHACHYVQFVIFNICSFEESLAVEFLEHLWKQFEDPNVQGVFRQAAMHYIASFLVRAKILSTPTVKTYVELIVAWIRRYIQLSPQNTRPDLRRHGPFYSACQALFYIFIYRHEELLESYGLKFCESLYLGSIVTSWLNPLRVCLPQVATKFASVVRNNRIAFCDTVIDRNRRYQLPEVHSVLDDGGVSSADRQFDSYFPFDQCTLPRSSHHFADSYRHVEGLHTESHRHRTISEDVKEDELYMDCDENVDPTNCSDLKLFGTSPGFMR